MKSKPRFFTPRIISEGTMRAQDVLSALLAEFDTIRVPKKDRARLRAARAALQKYNADETDREAMEEWCAEIEEIAQEYCAPYTYYGSSEGDGACFGVWASVESIEDDMRFGDLARVNDEGGPELEGEVVKAYSGLAAGVNDHGNVTLYSFTRGRARRVWSVV